MTATVVLDIGKTNVKLALIGTDGRQLAERRRANAVLRDGPYPHHDTEGIWQWMLDGLREFATLATIDAIVPVTHGATAALVDDTGLALPIPDYEHEPAAPLAQYLAVRPAYADTRSPRLPAGLNLGRQLAWLAAVYPDDFAHARQILMYPQYWAWRLSGVAAGEVTSLGCHTDLWDPARQRYSSLVDSMGWQGLMPPLHRAWDTLGTILPALAARTGVPAGCRILCGIHDSNASLLRHLGGSDVPAVLSTGTWVIVAAPGKALDGLREEADMLANTSALGQCVPSMRFMGGREFAELAGSRPASCDAAALQRLINHGTYALPGFAGAGGPFAGRAGRIAGPAPVNDTERSALATLYCVLMSDYCLSALGADADVVVEGSFTSNAHFAPLLAALRPGQQIAITDDASGTTCGGWMLAHWGSAAAVHATVAAPLALDGLAAYRDAWLAQLN